MGIFGLSFRKQKPLQWPLKEDGALVNPAVVKTVLYDDMEVEITINMLTAYNIPTDKRLRHKTREVDIFVPETLLSEALDIINATPEEENE